MDTRLLRVFREVARRGSLAEAAKRLHLTPSALSHSLKALETELGAQVFDRIGNRIVINYVGEQLLARIEQPLESIEDAVRSVKALEKWGKDRLRIGAATTFCQSVIPEALQSFTTTFPNVHLQIDTGDTHATIELLNERRIDICIGLETTTSRDIESRPLFEDELLFVYSKNHPWAQLNTLSVEEMSKRPLIFYQRQSQTFRSVEAYFKERGVHPIAAMEIGSVAAIREFVKRDLGVGVLPPWIVQSDLKDGELLARPMGTKRLIREWRLYHRRSAPLSFAGESFYKLCLEKSQKLIKNRDMAAAISAQRTPDSEDKNVSAA